jgi:hypothetical protein
LTGAPPFGERDSASILARELRGDVTCRHHGSPSGCAAFSRRRRRSGSRTRRRCRPRGATP